MPSRLEDELHRLVSAGVLRSDQADALRAAAEADAALSGRPQPTPTPSTLQPKSQAKDQRLQPERARASALVEVLGYIGGALLLGAVALLTVANWGEMGRAARVTTGTTAAVVLLGAAVLSAVFRGRDQLSSALASLGCCVAGFATYVVVGGASGRVAGVGVALALAALGVWQLAGSSLLVATFAILGTGVLVITSDVIGPEAGRTNQAGLAGSGFILVAIILALLGLVRDQVMAWSLAGAAVFSSSMCWLVQDSGEAMALAVGTAGSAALLVAYGRHRASAYAVVGCSILLVVWPTALYQLTDNLAGVAIGLVVASVVLFFAVVLLSRNQRRRAGG
ncbi:MAG TPA: hypothetical protein VGD71_35980 [Kribbella sp.]